jgi:hypothetical protein
MGKFNSFEEINLAKSRIFTKRIYKITENTKFQKKI